MHDQGDAVCTTELQKERRWFGVVVYIMEHSKVCDILVKRDAMFVTLAVQL